MTVQAVAELRRWLRGQGGCVETIRLTSHSEPT